MEPYLFVGILFYLLCDVCIYATEMVRNAILMPS